MIRAALYARFSSENQKESSITDQFRNCERRASRERWQIVQRYKDEGISGSSSQRPGYQAMLQDAKAKRFDLLLVDDLSRLTRDEAELITTRKCLVFWKIRLVSVDGFDTDQKGHKIQASFHGIKNELYLDELRDKTLRGLEGRALAGFNTGGRAYGYRHVRITDPLKRDRYGEPEVIAVKRDIDAGQAKWVRQIFRWYADGQSPRWIAGELNRLGVPAPGAAYHRNKRKSPLNGTWSASSIHGGGVKQGTGILHNPLYVGRMIWNRRQWLKNPETEQKISRLNPEHQWIVTERPELRIVDQALWDQVQARRKSRPEMKKATPGLNVKYLLSGLLVCAVCGSRFVMADSYRYGCAGVINKRSCSNTVRVPRKLVESHCLAGIQQQLLAPQRFDLFVKETTRLLAERRQQHRPDHDRAKQALVTIEKEIANLLAFIKQGGFTSSTKGELERLEGERQRLRDRLQPGPKDNLVTLLPRIKERYQALVSDLAAVGSRQVAPMREQIRHLVDAITLRPVAGGYLEARMVGRYEGLYKLVVGGKLNSAGCGERI